LALKPIERFISLLRSQDEKLKAEKELRDFEQRLSAF
jgi:hypothetical protein